MRYLLFILVLLLMLPLTGCDKQAPAKREVRAAWDAYVKANEELRGQDAAALLSKNTHDHYTKLLKNALDMPAKQCWELPPTQMYEICKIRNRFKKSEVKGIDGKGYLIISGTRGWNTDDDPGWSLTNIRINDTRATAEIYHPEWESEYNQQRVARALSRRARLGSRIDKPPRYPIELAKEGDAWKIDETSAHARQDQELRDLAKESRMSVRDFIMELEAMNTDQDKLPFTVWEPMKK